MFSRQRWLCIVAASLVAGTVVLTAQHFQEPQSKVLVRAGLYDRAEELAQAELDRLRTSDGDDAPSVLVASDNLLQASILNGHAATERALELAERTVRVKRARHVRGTELIPSLLNLADVLTA